MTWRFATQCVIISCTMQLVFNFKLIMTKDHNSVSISGTQTCTIWSCHQLLCGHNSKSRFLFHDNPIDSTSDQVLRYCGVNQWERITLRVHGWSSRIEHPPMYNPAHYYWSLKAIRLLWSIKKIAQSIQVVTQDDVNLHLISKLML